MEEVNILVRDIPKNKVQYVETLLKTFSESTGIKMKVGPAPIALANVVKYYEDLSAEIRGVKNQLNALRGEGFNVGTEKVEKILKLNVQHLTSVVAKMEKNFNQKFDAIEEKLKVPLVPLIREVKPIKKEVDVDEALMTKLKLGKRLARLRKMLKVLISNPGKFFSSAEIANKVYGKISRQTRAGVTQRLKTAKKFLEIKKEKGRIYYRIKENVFKKLMK